MKKTPGSGPSESDLNRILARAAAAKTSEYPKDIYPSSYTGGVFPTSIQGRFSEERARLSGEFTDTDRRWRMKWFHDQHLHADEPVKKAQARLDNELRNPLRRFYRIPGDWFQYQVLEPRIGQLAAAVTRHLTTKLLFAYGISLYCWYHIKYNHSTWERYYGVKWRKSLSPVLPGDERYPVGFEDARPNHEDYNDREFKIRKVFKDTDRQFRTKHPDQE